ncbi:unnamed protein product [Fusarium graminearum]|nr:unnamed protein product [Fusarium graminearum]VTO92964.1 unnamed protein product [Fusarium graminearum]
MKSISCQPANTLGLAIVPENQEKESTISIDNKAVASTENKFIWDTPSAMLAYHDESIAIP